MGLMPNDPDTGAGPAAEGATGSQGPTDGAGEPIPGLETEQAPAKGISLQDFQSLRDSVQNLVGRIDQNEKRYDRFGTEIGTVRTMLGELSAQRETPAATPQPQMTPEEEAEAFSRDPRGFLTSIVQESIKDAIPKPDPRAELNKLRKDDLRAFGQDYPDAKKYEGRMGELITREDNRVYDKAGNEDPYKTYRNVYLIAREEARSNAGQASNANRSNMASEQDAGKVLSTIPGASATQGTPGGLPKSLTPERLKAGLRGKSRKAILQFASQNGLVSADDPPQF